jgi:hypothetical protein
MAGEAFLVKAQESGRFFPDFPVSDEIGFMAVPAGLIDMGTFQFITRKGMIETTGIKAYHLKFSAMVITMALHTPFSHYVNGSMISPFFIHPDSDILMTFQTLRVGDLFP